jgi:hypothetical protein
MGGWVCQCRGECRDRPREVGGVRVDIPDCSEAFELLRKFSNDTRA